MINSTHPIMKVTFTVLTLLFFTSKTCDSYSTSTTPVSSLLKEHSSQIDKLKSIAKSRAPQIADSLDEVFFLRYCLSPNSSDEEETKTLLINNLTWRMLEGKSIVDAASAAIEAATSSSNKSWDNSPVRNMAPHSSIINQYITSKQCITTTTRQGDLCYCIRAGSIDDVALMSQVTPEQMVEFFLYCKEVNAIIANRRSLQSDHLVQIITANDLTGVKLIGGDATFRKALSAASNKANGLYPNVAGPTLLLNLPRLLSALVKLFTPLFSEEVRKRIKFEQGPLRDVSDLVDVSTFGSGDVAKRDEFLDQLDQLVYGKK